MLVLSRGAGESLIIGDDVVVTVLEIRGDVIRIGIDAPRHIKVHRSEVYEAIEASNKAAASPEGRDVSALTSALSKAARKPARGPLPSVDQLAAPRSSAATPRPGASPTPASVPRPKKPLLKPTAPPPTGDGTAPVASDTDEA